MQPKIIVLDDDPTGSQTVHGSLLLTRWDVETLKQGLYDASPLMFVLTNTRGMGAAEASQVTRETCHNLKLAMEGFGRPALFVSRSDSTLRGHYPVETDVMAEELGPFDAHFLVPAFFEGGRFTVDSIHYLKVSGQPVPVHETEFARDSVFGYRHSYLPDYVEEKTRGRIKADQVVRFTLNDIRAGSLDRLMALAGNACCVVDAEIQADLDRFADDLEQAASQGKRFLFRSAASLLTALAKLPPQPVAAEDMHRYVKNNRPGVVVVGSHVKKTTDQLQVLLQQEGIAAVEVDVSRMPEESPALLQEVLAKVAQAHQNGLTPVVFTSRVERQFPDQAARLAFGEHVSGFLMDVVHGLPATIGFIISKGGITSNDMLSKGLALPTTRLAGQILAGCSVVLTPADHAFPEIPVVIFPGNVGDEKALAEVYHRLRGTKE
ncbi:four-carbon acid sugar kinase family protein [Sulfuricella sp.]|uniref:four-carbon acid sugar kinase family protein n=1 Tax=Sulfuricella sp. TaxID=2099377 RepID=UPI002C1ED35F|nr:four-carbon acid sugar kinase family protein [Sulfuricella sp.]HUX64257.1 four-carbon acid sugar kinase family protein [Sulfuricella sp.]